MKRREFFGKSLFGAAAAAVSSILPGSRAQAAAPREFPPDFDYSKELARADWQPVFLSEHQNETLIVLSDWIIPETETPGAKAALVNRFIDHLLAAEAREVQQEFLTSLSFLDGECRSRYKEVFRHLSRERQEEFLTFVAYPHRHVTWQNNRPEYAGYEHFTRLKEWISRAYYSSEPGMRELGWTGNVFHGDFAGCPHPDGTHE